MTDKCGAVTPKYSSKLFIHKTLLSLQFLHGTGRYKHGASLPVITTYFKRHFLTDGDVRSQVLASLKEAVHRGFVQKRCGRYVLIGPVANVILTEHNSDDRKFQSNRSRQIFNSKWCSSGRRSKSCSRPCEPQSNQKRMGVLNGFLRKISDIFGTSSEKKCLTPASSDDAAAVEVESDSSDLPTPKMSPMTQLEMRCNVVRWKTDKLRHRLKHAGMETQEARQGDVPVSAMSFERKSTSNKETNTEPVESKTIVLFPVKRRSKSGSKKLNRSLSGAGKSSCKKRRRPKRNIF